MINIHFYSINDEYKLLGELLESKVMNSSSNIYIENKYYTIIVVKNNQDALLLDDKLWKVNKWLPHDLYLNDIDNISSKTIITTENVFYKNLMWKNFPIEYIFILNDVELNEKILNNVENIKDIFILFNNGKENLLYNRKRWKELKINHNHNLIVHK